MSNELVKHEQTSIGAANRTMPSGKEMIEFMETAKMLSACPYYQKLGPHGILAIWLTAREMNLPPMMCLNGGMYTFSGLVTLSGNMMNMMIVNAGHRVNVMQLDENTCKIQFWRCDRPNGANTFEFEYSTKEAEKAGLLNKDNWKKNRRDMLFNRCLSGGARKFMPDAIMGAYAVGELPDDAHVTDSIPSTITIPITPSVTEIEPQIEYCDKIQIQELHGLIVQCDPDKTDAFIKFLDGKILDGKLPMKTFLSLREQFLARRNEYQDKLINSIPVEKVEVKDEE